MAKSAATIVLAHGAWADESSWNNVILLRHIRVIAGKSLTSVEDGRARLLTLGA